MNNLAANLDSNNPDRSHEILERGDRAVPTVGCAIFAELAHNHWANNGYLLGLDWDESIKALQAILRRRDR